MALLITEVIFTTSGKQAENLRVLRELCRNCLVLLVGALKVRNFVVSFEVPNPGSDFIDQIVVMGDQQHCTLIALQGDIESVDRFQVQVVCRLVQNQDVGFLQH